jgi:phage tail P2-like protein
MTDLYNGQITDLLNNAYRYDPEVIAFSYAILQEKRRIMQELAQTRTMSVIDDLPESILDVLAVELRTPYYVDSLSVDAKREIIKKSFLWAARAGTVSAVEELIQAVFGEGEVVEWPDFTDEPRTPGTFDIVTSGQLTPDAATFFTRVVKRVKNVRSHIRRILIERHEKMQMYAAAGSLSEPHRPVLNHHQTTASGSLQESSPLRRLRRSPTTRRAEPGVQISQRSPLRQWQQPRQPISITTPPPAPQRRRVQYISPLAASRPPAPTS